MEMKLAPRAVRCPTQWAFARHSRAAGKAVRCRRGLAHHVQVAMQRSRVRLDPDHRPGLQAEVGGGAGAGSLVLGIPPASPGHEEAPQHQQRGRVFGHDRQRGQGPGGDQVASFAPVGPFLGSRVHRLGIADLACLRGAGDERALASDALHAAHARGGQGDGQGQAWKPRPRAQVGDRGGGANLGEVECDERVGEVVAQDPVAIRDRRRRVGVAGDAAEEDLELVPLAVAQPIPGRQIPRSGQRLRSRSMKEA
jgi:hypothetical protein